MKGLLHRLLFGKDPVGGHEGSSRVERRQAVYGHLYDRKKGDFYLGRAYLKDRIATFGLAPRLAHKSQQHLMLIGGTRSGKGRRVLMHNILDHPGNSFVIDPKGESAIICADALTRKGYRVILLDPFGQCAKVLGRPMGYEAGYNPLMDINPYDSSADVLIQALAAVLIKDEGASGDSGPFWRDATRTVCAGLMALSCVDYDAEQIEFLAQANPNDLTHEQKAWIVQFNNLRLATFFNEMDEDSQQQIVERMVNYDEDTAPDGETKIDYVGGLIRNGGRQAAQLLNKEAGAQYFASLLTMLGNNFAWAKPSSMEKSTRALDMQFRMTQLKTEEKLVVFAVLPEIYMEATAPWLKMLTTMAINTISGTPGKPRVPINLVIDEAPLLGFMPSVKRAFAIGAGQGARVILVMQDLSQMAGIYGDSFETFIGNSSQMVLSVSDNFTTEYFSRKAGQTYAVDQKTKKQDPTRKVPVLSLDEIARFTHPERGGAFYLEGGKGPIRIRLTNYDSEKRAGRDYRVHPDHLPARKKATNEPAAPNVLRIEDARKERGTGRHVVIGNRKKQQVNEGRG